MNGKLSLSQVTIVYQGKIDLGEAFSNSIFADIQGVIIM
jgi:hypothetical protein